MDARLVAELPARDKGCNTRPDAGTQFWFKVPGTAKFLRPYLSARDPTKVPKRALLPKPATNKLALSSREKPYEA